MDIITPRDNLTSTQNTVNVIRKIKIGNDSYDIAAYDKNAVSKAELNELLSRLSAAPLFQHKCHSCGAAVTLDVNRHIFICPYCDSAYAIGTAQIHDFV